MGSIKIQEESNSLKMSSGFNMNEDDDLGLELEDEPTFDNLNESPQKHAPAAAAPMDDLFDNMIVSPNAVQGGSSASNSVAPSLPKPPQPSTIGATPVFTVDPTLVFDDEDYDDLRDLEMQEITLDGHAAPSPLSLAATGDYEGDELIEGEGRKPTVGRSTKTGEARPKYYGRIRVYRFFGIEAYIAPHWIFSIGLILIMLLITAIFYKMVVPNSSWYHGPFGTILIACSYISYIRLLFSNPGVLGKGSNEIVVPFNGSEQLFPSQGRMDCEICDITQPSGSLHCEFCQVCIAEYDHHCPWTSKCIGKGNLSEFYQFLGWNISTFFYILIFAVLSTAPNDHRSHGES